MRGVKVKNYAWPMLCYLFLGSLSAFAGPPQLGVSEPGVEISHIAYREPGIMSQRGLMFGVLYSHTFLSDTQAKLEVKLSTGTVRYTGSLQDENRTPMTVTGIMDRMFELRGVWGLSRPSAPFFEGPYAGLGYRYLSDGMDKSPFGYRREANYYYAPVGYEHTFLLETENGWTAGFIVEYDLFLLGRQVSYLSDVNPGLNDMTNEQQMGYGYRASMKFRKSGGRRELTIEPFLRSWKIDRSNSQRITFYGEPTNQVGLEPKNDSTELGMKFIVRY